MTQENLQMNLDELLASGNKVTGFSSEIMKAAAEKIRAASVERAVKAAQDAIETADDKIKSTLSMLRDLRKRERAVADELKKLDRASKYLAETGNPLPFYKASDDAYRAKLFLSSSGLDSEDFPMNKHPAYLIPDDWNPKN